MNINNNIEIYNEDFRTNWDKYKDNINIIISDPPYNINFKYDLYSDDLNDYEYIEMLNTFERMPTVLIHYPEETMKYIVPAMGIPNKVIAWCYNSNISRNFRLINCFNVVPNFNNVKQPYKNPTDKRIKKLIDNGSEGSRLYDWFSDIQLVKNVSKDFNHPCPVPVELIKRIILLTTKEGDLVCDPFMGSGTTALACMLTNRRFIGFEIDKNYFETAVKRINSHSLCSG